MLPSLNHAQEPQSPDPLQESPGKQEAAWPDPLTLEQALGMAAQGHPDLELAEAQRREAEAELAGVKGETGFMADITLAPQMVDPVVNTEDEGWVEDSYARARVSKRIYDFGRSRSRELAASETLEVENLELFNARQQHQLKVMKRFLDVILSDLKFAYDNESMAHKYVRFDKTRESHQLGRVSDVELLEQESSYQQFLVTRTRSQLNQSTTRSLLAASLNRTGELPDKLARPKLDQYTGRPVPDYFDLLKTVLDRNPRLQACRKKVEVAEARVEAARSKRWPVLDAEARGYAWQRERGDRNSGEVGIQLKVPLYQGGQVGADIAREQAALHKARANLRKCELALNQTVLDIVQRVEELRVLLKSAQVELDYADLHLDRQRGLYELERQTTLGDAMILVTRAHWQLARAEFELALTWVKIDALQGKILFDDNTGAKP